ncbi:hypothetical protein Rahaq_1801 [Rahnella aceris]|uniref:Uncharacterized protein n=1 Tax=Rahnella sp. (strain Y9602) TaxID=2703885 RepID=A0A0H3F917_RAHSY|nr:hypothetical protein Rahaq_1801 [Rahnella aceris]
MKIMEIVIRFMCQLTALLTAIEILIKTIQTIGIITGTQ